MGICHPGKRRILIRVHAKSLASLRMTLPKLKVCKAASSSRLPLLGPRLDDGLATGFRGVFPGSARCGRLRGTSGGGGRSGAQRPALPLQVGLWCPQRGGVPVGFQQPARSTGPGPAASRHSRCTGSVPHPPGQSALEVGVGPLGVGQFARGTRRMGRTEPQQGGQSKVKLGHGVIAVRRSFLVPERPNAARHFVELQQLVPGVGQRGGLFHRLPQVAVDRVLHVDGGIDRLVAPRR